MDSGLRLGELSRRFTALVHNTVHNNEHYGNRTTYLLRINSLNSTSSPSAACRSLPSSSSAP